jgi:hypothetical protein
METKEKITSHFGFGEHWNELPEYAGYMPTQFNDWHMLKQHFYVSGNYGYMYPLRIDLKKGNSTIVMNLFGFKIPETPPVSALGTNAAITGRVALCKTIASKEYIAIAW